MNIIRRDEIRQAGVSTMQMLCIVVMVAWVGIVIFSQLDKYRKIEVSRKQPPISLVEIHISDKYRKKTTPYFQYTGRYIANYEIEDVPIKSTILLDYQSKSIVVERIVDGGVTYTGGATYTFDGATLRYSNVQGDAILFSLTGTPVDEISEDVFSISDQNGDIVYQSIALIEQEYAELAAIKHASMIKLESQPFWSFQPKDQVSWLYETDRGLLTLKLLIGFFLIPLIVQLIVMLRGY